MKTKCIQSVYKVYVMYICRSIPHLPGVDMDSEGGQDLALELGLSLFREVPCGFVVGQRVLAKVFARSRIAAARAKGLCGSRAASCVAWWHRASSGFATVAEGRAHGRGLYRHGSGCECAEGQAEGPWVLRLEPFGSGGPGPWPLAPRGPE